MLKSLFSIISERIYRLPKCFNSISDRTFVLYPFMHASSRTASLLACWVRFVLLPSHTPADKKHWHSLANFREQMSGVVREKSRSVVAGGCHHYASAALNCCTDRRNQMNILTQTKGGKKTCRQELNRRGKPLQYRNASGLLGWDS